MNDDKLTGGVRAAAVVLFTVLGAMSAGLEILLVPFYIGGVIFPVTLVLAVVGNAFLASGLRALVGSAGLASLPLVAWILVVFFMGFANDSKGDVLLPGYGQGQYVALGLPLVGLLAGFVSLFLEPRPRRLSQRRPSPTSR
jgi:hypothetical protein